jgi:hypothetical protein
MKAESGLIQRSENLAADRGQVLDEILSFLAALDSYPQGFAEGRCASFEEHRRSQVNDGQSARRIPDSRE